MGVLLLLILGSVLVCAGHAASVKFCSDDNECNKGEFCYLKTKACSPCVQCKAYERKNSGSCAREPAQCGDCLEGFENEILTDGHTRDLCVRLANVDLAYSTAPTIPPPRPMLTAEMSIYILLGIGVVGAVLGTFILSPFSKLKGCIVRVKTQHQFQPCADSSSSLSNLYGPSAPPQGELSIDGAEVAMLKTPFYNEKTWHEHQNAGVFCNPQWVRSDNSDDNNQNNQMNEPQDVVDGPPGNLDIDEDTMPSSWTPGTEYNNPSSGASALDLMPTTFAGILQLNSAASSTRQGSSDSTNHTASGNTPNADSSSAHPQSVVNITFIQNSGPSINGVINNTKM